MADSICSQDRPFWHKRSSAFVRIVRFQLSLPLYHIIYMVWAIWYGPASNLGNFNKERVVAKCNTLALNHYCYLVALCDWKSSWAFWGLQKLISADQELELISWFRIFYSEVYISEFFLIEFFIMISVVFSLFLVTSHTHHVVDYLTLVVVW